MIMMSGKKVWDSQTLRGPFIHNKIIDFLLKYNCMKNALQNVRNMSDFFFT